jgi:hypothetical protein
MSDMVERGARELYERDPFRSEALGGELTWDQARELAPQHPQLQLFVLNCENRARAALLAAIDPEDEALVEFIAKEMASERVWGQRAGAVNRSYFRERAKAVLVALKAMAQGDTVD